MLDLMPQALPSLNQESANGLAAGLSMYLGAGPGERREAPPPRPGPHSCRPHR